MIKFNDSVRDRFIRYTTYDTMSDGNASGNRRPTTEGQEELLLVLKRELEELGLETYYGEEKVVMGVLKGNTSGSVVEDSVLYATEVMQNAGMVTKNKLVY